MGTITGFGRYKASTLWSIGQLAVRSAVTRDVVGSKPTAPVWNVEIVETVFETYRVKLVRVRIANLTIPSGIVVIDKQSLALVSIPTRKFASAMGR